jgi:cell division protein FtsB
MKASSLITATLMGLGIYLLLELIFGQYGLISHRALNSFHQDSLMEQDMLQKQTDFLQRQVRLLTTDAETIRLEAREIGFVARDEVVLRLEGRDPRPRHRYQPGALPSRVPRVRDNRPLFRSVGFTVFLLTLLVQITGLRAVRLPKRTSRRSRQDGPWKGSSGSVRGDTEDAENAAEAQGR